MSSYLTVVSNLASLPSILYFMYRDKKYISFQIGLTAFFSLLHHMIQDGSVKFFDNKIFITLDLIYSYWLIYIMQLYLFIGSNIENLNLSHTIVYPIMIILSMIKIDSLYILPIVLFIGFFNMMFICSTVKLNICNHYFILLTVLGSINVYVFWQAYQSDYNYFHSLHHLICFNLPIAIDRYIVTEEKRENIVITV